MDRCDELRDYLAAYADGELDETLGTRVREHVEACADCRGELEGLERVDAMFRAAVVPEVPARDWERMSRALDRAMGASASPAAAPARRGWLSGWLIPASALAAAAALVAAFLLWPAGPPSSSSSSIVITDLETGPGYDIDHVDLPAQDGDFLVIDVTNVE